MDDFKRLRRLISKFFLRNDSETKQIENQRVRHALKVKDEKEINEEVEWMENCNQN